MAIYVVCRLSIAISSISRFVDPTRVVAMHVNGVMSMLCLKKNPYLPSHNHQNTRDDVSYLFSV